MVDANKMNCSIFDWLKKPTIKSLKYPYSRPNIYVMCAMYIYSQFYNNFILFIYLLINSREQWRLLTIVLGDLGNASMMAVYDVSIYIY